ncbi:CDGSH iron-sulfur domain-containing protein [Xanthovirga aplysinae]|uniref:CDGSH iron-sulfur domain-containing protein n=1 Tax=Xanthovirga aplysinae TaxID=2529853 RepID=UPI0012BC4129|nr:CDGSH iron-sulfur domain-containing protein [Xanthovirga aplysinae]MTI33220.1 CDGSH iron-sulfur domain-containing protein [Xanthovirga aplysinae]
MSEEPKIAQKGPYILEMEPGTYFWCRCGRSKTQPFCDESHKGTSFTPIEVKIEKKSRIFWCGCKHSGNKPYCDGSHARLKEEKVSA